MIWISETEFRAKCRDFCQGLPDRKYHYVTGPGRSGAIASSYISHMTNIPFRPHKAGGAFRPKSRLLIVDTVEMTGQTIEKALRYYSRYDIEVESMTIFERSKIRHRFFYEEGSPV